MRLTAFSGVKIKELLLVIEPRIAGLGDIPDRMIGGNLLVEFDPIR